MVHASRSWSSRCTRASLSVVAWSAASLVWLGGRSASADGGGGNPCLPHDATPNQVVVELLPGGSISEVLAAIEPAFPGVDILAALEEEGLYLLAAPEPICEQALITELLLVPGVEEAEFNEVGESVEGQTQSFFFASTAMDHASQYLWGKIKLIDAHTESLGDGVLVAVIDSGLDSTHPVFAETVMLPGLDFVNDGQGLSDLGNGIDEDADGVVDELAGHGTFVAGLIATIAPHATILPLRAIDTDGHGTVFAVASALLAARDAGADVINLSFGTGEDIGALEPIIEELLAQGVLVVVSAGNSGQVTDGTFPASKSGVCAVAATDASDVKAAFSNAGSYISLCAPGVEVISAFPGGGYVMADGTSASAAIATGTAALVMSKARCDGDVALTELTTHAESIALANPEYAADLGSGRVHAGASVDAIPVPGDFDHDRRVDGDDIAFILGAWGTAAADVNGDGTTDALDLSVVIGGWTG